jgi:hypothetical protein
VPKKPSKRGAARQARPTASADRLPLQEAFNRLRVRNEPHVACERINIALRENRLRLWCDGTLLAPGYIAANLLVVVRLEADGRPHCIIEPHGARLGFDPSRPYVWEVEGDIEATPAKDKGGKPVEYDWRVIDFEITDRFFNNHPPKPGGIGRFAQSMRDWCERQALKAPSQEHTRAHVREMISAYERWRSKK